MPREQLKQALQSLQAQIDGADDLDADVEARLQEALAEIHDALSGKPAQGAFEALQERVGEVADRFEDSHPTLASTLGQLSDLLSRVGI